MSSEVVGLPPPAERPDRPPPPELAGNTTHGYNCRCVARHFGLDPAGYGETPACALSAAEYARLDAEVDALHVEAKRLAARRDATAALASYNRMRELGTRLDRTDVELAAVSDLASLCYAAGDLRGARQCAEAVGQMAPVAIAAMVHFGQYAELRAVEGAQEVAEKTLISLCTEEGDLDQARELIARQRTRHARRATAPDQFPADQLDELGTHELELRIFEVRILVAAGDLAAARARLDPIIAELTALAATGDDRVETLLAMARAELVRLRQDGGQADDAVAELIRTRALLVERGDVAAAAKAATQLAFTQAEGGDVAEAVRTIVEARDQLAAAGMAGDLAEASFALGTILLGTGDVSQARPQFEHAATVWRALGDGQGTSRLDFVLAQCDAAEGKWDSALRHTESARAAARSSGAWLECVRADLLTAVVLHARAHTLPHDECVATLREALAWVLPAALAADEYRFRFPAAAVRTAWSRGVVALAMELAMAVLTQLGESRLLAEMVERTCSVGSFTEADGPAPPPDVSAFTTPPELVETDDRLPLAALASVSASVTTPLRLAPPPALRWSPGSPMELRRWQRIAADRYHLAPPPDGEDGEDGEVPTW